MKKIFFGIVCFLVLLIASYHLYRYLTKPISPFKTYAADIPNSYRLGFTNLDNEVQDQKLVVQGTIPHWLSGTLLRNGPAKFYTEFSWVSNWFDGLAMLHAFSIHNGAVSYSNKFLITTDYLHVQKTGNMNYAGFMQDPCASLFKNLFSWFIEADHSLNFPAIPNANVNIVQYGDRFAALTEIPLPVAFDPKTLQTIGVVDYQDQLPKKGIHDTPHPHYDPATQEHIAYFTQFDRISTVYLVAIADATMERRVIASYQVEKPSYMHSFALIPRYAVLTALPLVVNPLKLLLGKPFINSFSWEPERGTQLVVIDRHEGKIQGMYKAPPFFAFHVVNAFEKNDAIVLDIITYQNTQTLQEGMFDYLLAPHKDSVGATGLLHRYIIDLAQGAVEEKQILDNSIELPRINYAYNGKEYVYVYTVEETMPRARSYVPDALLKINVQNGQTTRWQEPHCFPGEPVFVAAPNAQKEDDGVVMAVVLDSQKGVSFLLILGAATFTEIARAYAPHHIPFGIHGNYFSSGRV